MLKQRRNTVRAGNYSDAEDITYIMIKDNTIPDEVVKLHTRGSRLVYGL